MQVPPNGSGSLVFRIDPLAPAAEVLKEHDVMMEIEVHRLKSMNLRYTSSCASVRHKHIPSTTVVSRCAACQQVMSACAQGVPIADDGTVEFRNEERVEFTHIVRSKHIGAGRRRYIHHAA